MDHGFSSFFLLPKRFFLGTLILSEAKRLEEEVEATGKEHGGGEQGGDGTVGNRDTHVLVRCFLTIETSTPQQMLLETS